MTDPVSPQKEPYAVALEAGNRYAWCACGRSASQPFCDGSHKEVGMSPVVFTAEKSGTAYLCGCKHSAGQPFCDGTHNSV